MNRHNTKQYGQFNATHLLNPSGLCSNGCMEAYFPQTLESLKKSLASLAAPLIAELQNLPTYQVPMFLKEQGMGPEILEIAYYESVRASVAKADLGPTKLMNSGIGLNPSLQWVAIQNPTAAQILKKKPGMYIFWKHENDFHEMSISKKQAQVLDLLMDDLIPLFSNEDHIEIEKFRNLGIVHGPQTEMH